MPLHAIEHALTQETAHAASSRRPDPRCVPSPDRRHRRDFDLRRLSRRRHGRDAQRRSRCRAKNPGGQFSSRAAHLGQHVSHPRQGPHGADRCRLGHLHGRDGRLDAGQHQGRERRSGRHRHGAAHPHASRPLGRADRQGYRQEILPQRRTRDAREGIAALDERRRDGQGRRARAQNVLRVRPRAGGALQGSHPAVQGRRGVSRRHGGAEPRPYAGAHRLPRLVGQGPADDLGRHGAQH